MPSSAFLLLKFWWKSMHYVKKIVLAVVVIALAVSAYFFVFKKDEGVPTLKTAKVSARDIVTTIDATGTLEAEDFIEVGARVSGEIVSFGKDKEGKVIDYSSEVKEGDILALIDDEIPKSDLLEAQAGLDSAKAAKAQASAELLESEATYNQAYRDWKRAEQLGVSDALSQSAYDSYLASYEAAKARVETSKAKIIQADAQIVQAEASVSTAKRNLDYCVIKSPVDGVVVDRMVSIGQTVVSNMSASSLFLIASDLKRMEAWASVNEADIGHIKKGQKVKFTVDAFPDKTFEGVVQKIRLNATMSQNVVTYVVEVVFDNEDLLLFPYLTANLNFEVSRAEKAKCVPNAALHFTPDWAANFPAKKDASKSRIWVLTSAGELEPRDVTLGMTDGVFTQILSDEIKLGDEVVTGVELVKKEEQKATNPFGPKPPRFRKNSNQSKQK